MVSKIFEILAGIKKTSHITKAVQAETVEKIVSEVTAGQINPVEAYVMLDYLKKVVDEAQKDIKAQTLEYIKSEGEKTAFNVELNLVAKKDYAYEEDKDWSDRSRTISVYKDAQTAREKFLKDLVSKSIEAGRETPISFTTSISIIPKPLSNT
jgi:hypothetical protein